MMNYKAPSFQERIALAAEARQKALDKLRAKPPVDEAVVAARKAAKLAKEEAALAAREAKRAAIEEEKAAKLRAIEEAAALAEAEAAKLVLTEEEKKAARDARYAQRKQRVGR